jgi:hypothetical protein
VDNPFLINKSFPAESSMETDFSFNDKYFFPHRQEVSGKTEKRKKKRKGEHEFNEGPMFLC